MYSWSCNMARISSQLSLDGQLMQEKHRLISLPWVWIHSLLSPFGLPLHICHNDTHLISGPSHSRAFLLLHDSGTAVPRVVITPERQFYHCNTGTLCSPGQGQEKCRQPGRGSLFHPQNSSCLHVYSHPLAGIWPRS